MRFILLFIGLLVFPLMILYSQENANEKIKDVVLDLRKVPLTDILSEIEEQYSVSFSYESSVVTGIMESSLTEENVSLETCLHRLFSSLPIMFQISGRVVILKKKPRHVVINGFVRDQDSSESLIGASVYDLKTKKGIATNSYGFFSLSLSPGDVDLQVSYIGYQSQIINFSFIERDTFLIVELGSNTLLDEIVVLPSEQEGQSVLTTQMGSLEINNQTIRNTPVIFGESDIIRTLQLTPGVAPGIEGLAGMYVRGGNMDENLFLIDGNPVYQVNHIGGIFSAFNPEVIKGMDFFKAGFPARYGGRLSSVVDVHTKEGNMKEFEGSASLGLISANLRLEGPIVKDRTSFVVSFRRTWLDAITTPMFALINKKNQDHGEKTKGNYYFYDLNLKLNHRFNDRSRLFISLYNGTDKLYSKNHYFNLPGQERFLNSNHRSDLRWGNMMTTAGWTYVFNEKLFGKISGFYTQYRSSMKQNANYESGNEEDNDYLKYSSSAKNITGISDFGGRASFDYLPSNAHRIRFGGDGILHRFRPEYSNVSILHSDSVQTGTVFTDELFWAREFGAFVEDDWLISPVVRLNAGLRYSLFNVEKKTYMALEPRISFRWLLKKNISLKVSYSRMNQYVHLLSTSYVNMPTDAWMPVTRKLKPLVCDHMSAGLFYNLRNEYDFSMEGYYKHFNNLLDYKDDYTFLPSSTSWEDKLTSGSGRGYGMELMARKQSGKTTGWIGYALSWSDRKFSGIDGGKRFPSRFDNRHKLNMVLVHKLTPKIELSAAWTYSTGNRMTLSLEGYEALRPGVDGLSNGNLNLILVDYFDKRNNFRLPDYHRLDLGLNIYRPKKNGRMGIWNISIYNAYCRKNPFMVYKTVSTMVPGLQSEGSWQGARETGNPLKKYYYYVKYKQVSILPIVPSITYTYKF